VSEINLLQNGGRKEYPTLESIQRKKKNL